MSSASDGIQIQIHAIFLVQLTVQRA